MCADAQVSLASPSAKSPSAVPRVVARAPVPVPAASPASAPAAVVASAAAPFAKTLGSAAALPYERRATYAANAVARELLTLMAAKRTNLAVAADVTTCAQVGKIWVGERGGRDVEVVCSEMWGEGVSCEVVSCL